ncbi:S8 family serine peptidase [Mycoplasma simbae]|uniref:S8 family serine peptidase n=1 Tax=Mycoplasma simbae TaxID=36744 RepID=UPI000498527C|nr:S8 family serine peptidase [Mycoplasma simbae]
MKLKNATKFMSLGTIFVPLTLVSAKLEKNTNYENTIIEKLGESNYELLKKIYLPYYEKLGLKRHLKNNEYYSTSFDKVGIIEVDGIDKDYLVSKNKNFNINIRENSKNNSWSNHGYAVSSIIGTDLGINKDAIIYYDYLNNVINGEYTHLFEKVKFMHENHGVKLFNMSLSHFNTPYLYYKNVIFPNDKLEPIIPTNDITFNFDIEFLNAVHYLCELIIDYLYVANEDFNLLYKESEITQQYRLINNYIYKNDIKIVKSSGNSNFGLKDVIKNVSFFKDNYLNTSQLIQGLLSFINTFNSMHEDTQNRFYNESLFNEFDAKFLSFLLLKNKYKKVSLDKNKIFAEIFKFEYLNKSYMKWQNLTYCENFIYVGAVDFENKAMYFSSHNDSEHNDFPLISAYGNSLSKDSSSIDATKKHKSNIRNLYAINADTLIKDKINYLIHFDGTSKAAPMITGLLSLLQHNLNRNLSIAEAKLLLMSSSTYSTKTKNVPNPNSIEYLLNSDELFNDNMSKSKTGFGIPKYFKMHKIFSNDQVINVNKYIKNVVDASEPGSAFALNEKNITNAENITTSLILVKDFPFEQYVIDYGLIDDGFEQLISQAIDYAKTTSDSKMHLLPPKDRDNIKLHSKVKYSYNTHIDNSTLNIVDTHSMSRWSDSKLSDIERTYFNVKSKKNDVALSTTILLKELDYYCNALWNYMQYTTGDLDDYIWYGYRDKILSRNTNSSQYYKYVDQIRKLYFKYLLQHSTMLAFIGVE